MGFGLARSLSELTHLTARAWVTELATLLARTYASVLMRWTARTRIEGTHVVYGSRYPFGSSTSDAARTH